MNAELDLHMPYEGAGFLLSYDNAFVMGIRIKKPEDVAKDPIVELEYMGGKPEDADNNEPLKTAYNELVEEVGAPFLEADWRSRVTAIHTFQKFSKKWIHCSLLQLIKIEYERLIKLDAIHDEWNVTENRDLSAETGRLTPVRKAIKAFVKVDAEDLSAYIRGFSAVADSGNRMADAKKYRTTAKLLEAIRLSTGEVTDHPLRAFNTVIFEEHVKEITAVTK